MLETLVHIGQHKTGTTSIQSFLQNNREALMRRGLYVPSSIAGYDSPSHFILNVYSLNKDRSSPMKEKLIKKNPELLEDLTQLLRNDISLHYSEAKACGCQKIIWTNEGLYLLNSKEEYNRIYDLFTPHSSKITAICCFRDKNFYKESYTKQLIKQNITFSDQKDSYRYINDDSWLFDYDLKINLLNSTFDDVTTYAYNREDNVKAFMDQIGYPIETSEVIRLNVTASNQKI